MIDLGISKLALIGAVALIVIGPERLPKVARTVGALVGRAQRYINDVKAEVSREVELEELRKMRTEFEDAARDVERTIHKEVSEQTQALNEALAVPREPAAAVAPTPVAASCQAGMRPTRRTTGARAGAQAGRPPALVQAPAQCPRLGAVGRGARQAPPAGHPAIPILLRVTMRRGNILPAVVPAAAVVAAVLVALARRRVAAPSIHLASPRG